MPGWVLISNSIDNIPHTGAQHTSPCSQLTSSPRAAIYSHSYIAVFIPLVYTTRPRVKYEINTEISKPWNSSTQHANLPSARISPRSAHLRHHVGSVRGRANTDKPRQHNSGLLQIKASLHSVTVQPSPGLFPF